MLDEAGVLDFGELILRAIRLLGQRPDVLRRLSERYRTVLVDEYQDTNFAQGVLLRLLVREHRNVCVVGDDDQSIYRFRGASRKNIADFERHFPEAKVVRLEQNYRSLRAILDASNAVIEPSEDRMPKTLAADRQGALQRPGAGLLLALRERARPGPGRGGRAGGGDRRAERRPGDTAVLVRSVRNEGQLVATALEERGIPHRDRRRGALLRALRGQGPARVASPADRPQRRTRGRARPDAPPVELSSVDLARTTQMRAGASSTW